MTTTQYREAVAGEVRAEFARAGVTLGSISERTGIPVSTLSRKARALSPFTVDELAVIADALDIDPARLFPTRASLAA